MRLPEDLGPNDYSRRLEAARRAGRDLLDLTTANPTECGIEYPSLDLPTTMSYRPDPRGLSSARKAVADLYGSRGVSVDPDEIILSSSTSEAYSFLFKAFSEPGDEVLHPRPGYPLIEMLAPLDGLRPVPYALDPSNRWSLDLDSVRDAVSDRTAALIAISPGNPAGNRLRTEERRTLEAIASDRGLILIVDEVFGDYVLREEEGRVKTSAEGARFPTFVLDGLSKSCGLPGLKLAWIVVSGPGSDEAIERIETVADAYLSVGQPVQEGLSRILEVGAVVRRRVRKRLQENLRTLVEAEVPDAAWTLESPEGGWSAPVRLPAIMDDDAWAARLLEADGVVVQPGYLFDLPPVRIVVSLLVEPKTFREGIRRLCRRVERESGPA